MLDLRGLAPLFFDMPASLKFYCDLLGCEVVSADGKTAPESHWVLLTLNGVELMLHTAYERCNRPAAPDLHRMAAHRDTCLYFGCPDVDNAYDLLHAKGLTISPPRIAGYGMKQLDVPDPDGYLLCFNGNWKRTIRQRRLEAAMRTFLHAIRFYSLVTWVGGLLFFAFTLAPTAFHTLPAHEAGLIVGATLPTLHRTGFACGLLFLAAAGRDRRERLAQRILVFLMLLVTFYIQDSILPKMERDRAQSNGDIATTPPDAPAHLDFDRLHKQSEQLEGGVLLLGLAVITLIATESNRPATSPR